MHDVRITVPEGQRRNVNPLARTLADRVMTAPWFDPGRCSMVLRQPRAIVGKSHRREITDPMIEPPIEVFEDLWQLTHLTRSYIARALAGALILGYGMMEHNPITIVIVALFLPFVPQVLAIRFGIWARDRTLFRQGIQTLLTSTVLAVLAGMVVMYMHRGPMRFTSFSSPLVGFLISIAIGTTAGIINADDAGRRFLIGVGAAVHFGIYPVWFGACIAHGFPEAHIATFFVNVASITGSGLLAYLAVRPA